MTPVHLGLALCDDSASDALFHRLLSKLTAPDALKKLKYALQNKAKHLPKQDPPPDSVAPDSALVRILKSSDGLRKANGDSHVAVDHGKHWGDAPVSPW